MADDAVVEALKVASELRHFCEIGRVCIICPTLKTLADECERLRAERDAAIEALRPFAEALTDLERDYVRDDDADSYRLLNVAGITLGGLRKARALVAKY